MEFITCPRDKCGHTWVARVPNPTVCPRCKGYLPKQAAHDAMENHDEKRRFPRKPQDSLEG